MLTRPLCCIAAGALLAAACGSSTIVSDQALGAVVTVVDSGPALSSARTFVLPDTVILLAEFASAIDSAMTAEVVAEVRGHFVALGWTEIRDTVGSRPDVVVLLAASTKTQTGVLYPDWFSAWGYLPYWGAGVDPSWAWAFPGGAVPYSYQTGTLLVTMIDVRVPRADTKTIPMLWAAAINGLLGTGSTRARIQAGIDQAFEQSPYLRLD